jgi:hypothetical protein
MDSSLPRLDAATQPRPSTFRAVWRTIDRARARRAQRAARWAADRELALRTTPPLRLSWRVEELVSTKHRLDLAHSIRSVVREASPRYLPAASPINRVAVRAEAETLLALAEKLADLSAPVAARGVVLAERLLNDAAGPLYDRELVDELPPYLDSAIAALTPR